MITRISGRLEQLEGNAATVEIAGGLAYEVLVPAYLAQRLRRAASANQTNHGERATGAEKSGVAGVPLVLNVPITLHTLEYLEGQGQGTSFIPRLIGFDSPAERDFFDLLTTVKGLGNKRTLRALAVEPATVVQAIVGRDARQLQSLPEIGKKLAETIILELRDKAQKFAGLLGVDPASIAAAASGAAANLHENFSPQAMEAISAITNLGEAPHVAEQMVARALRLQPKLGSADEIISAAYSSRVA